jgi:hypothetical protein
MLNLQLLRVLVAPTVPEMRSLTVPVMVSLILQELVSATVRVMVLATVRNWCNSIRVSGSKILYEELIDLEGKRKEIEGRRMNLDGDSNPTQINATESKMQSGTQAPAPYRSPDRSCHPNSIFLLPSSFVE